MLAESKEILSALFGSIISAKREPRWNREPTVSEATSDNGSKGRRRVSRLPVEFVGHTWQIARAWWACHQLGKGGRQVVWRKAFSEDVGQSRCI